MRSFFLMMIVLGWCATSVMAQKLAPELMSRLAEVGSGEKIPVIIQLGEPVVLSQAQMRGKAVRAMSAVQRKNYRANLIRSLQSQTRRSQERLRKFVRQQGGEPKSLWINNSLVAELTPQQIRELAQQSEVADIRLDALVRLAEPQIVTNSVVENNLELIHAPSLWALGVTGEGSLVALIDTGVDHLHADLNDSWRGGSNSWFNPIAADCAANPLSCDSCDASADIPCDFVDDYGISHGTGVAGIIVGGDAGGSAIGVAPGAQWIAAKIFKSDGTARISHIHQAFQWVLDPDGDPDTDDAPDAVNSSWGLDSPGICLSEFRSDVQSLTAAGIAAIFPAGNEGPGDNSDISPANYPDSLSIGSVGSHDAELEISDFSGRGPSSCSGATYPDLVASSFFVRSADSTDGGRFPNSHSYYSGTSFAVPQLVGVVALLNQAFPTASLDEIRSAMTASAQDLGTLGPDNLYGHGLLDALGAYDWLSAVPNLLIYDPVFPENDHQLDFGEVSTGDLARQTIVISNVGRGELQISALQLLGDSVFTLLTDDCGGQTLTAAQSCEVEVGFSSALSGDFAASIRISSNDVDAPSIDMDLAGQAAAGVAQSPRVVLTDTIAPTADGSLPFGVLPLGTSREENFQLNNAESGDLLLGSLDSAGLPAGFSLSSDGCSGQHLLRGDSCLIGVEFHPLSSGFQSGKLRLTSNDPRNPSLQLQVSGTGNHLPPQPVLIAPTPGATDLQLPVEFVWRQQQDTDGQTIIDQLYIDTDPDFTGTEPLLVVGFPGGTAVLPAGVGMLLATGLLLGRRRSLVFKLMFLSVLVPMLISCGGGGGGGGSGSNTVRRQTVTGLSSGTTYYWKVVADDGSGGIVESAVASFTTQ